AFSGNGKCEGMEFFTVLDELVYVVEHVFVKGRRQQAAIAESAMPKFRAALAPCHDFSALEMPRSFFQKLLFPVQVFVSNFAVVQDRFNFLGSRLGAKSERIQRSATGTAGNLFPREKSSSYRGARVPRDGLDVHVAKTAALLES